MRIHARVRAHALAGCNSAQRQAPSGPTACLPTSRRLLLRLRSKAQTLFPPQSLIPNSPTSHAPPPAAYPTMTTPTTGDSAAAAALPSTTSHLSELTSIERDIASLLSIAGESIKNPTRSSIAEYHRCLASIGARLQRQVVALRAADIVVGLEPKGGDRVGREMERECWGEAREGVEGRREDAADRMEE